MIQLRLAWLLSALLLLTSLMCVHSSEQHLQSHESVISESSSTEQQAVARLGYYTQRSLQILEKVRLYAFSGKGDDVKESQWPQLRLGWRVVTAVVLAFLGGSICSAGGVGGGGLFIPIFNLLLQFDAKTSAALSNFVILGGSLANLIWNLPQRHPILPHKTMIDYDVAVILQPNMLLGISIGVLCNVMFPGWLIITQLAVILGYITVRSSKNAMKRWRVETLLAALAESEKSGDGLERGEEGEIKQKLVIAIAVEEAEAEANEPLGLDQKSLTGNGNSGGSHFSIAAKEDTNDLHTPLLESSHSSTLSLCYVSKIFCLGLVWLAFFVIQLLRGSKTTKGILPMETCGFGYWLLTASQIPLACFATVWMALRHPKKCSSQLEEQSDLTRSRALTLFPGMALLAGLLGGMLGIGGGMIINPMLIEIGMHPQVTAATSAFMIFFSSSMSVVEFWLLGRIPMDFALVFAALCFVASLVGLCVVHHAIAMYGRASIIVFSVSIVMGISSILMAGFGSIDVWRQYMAGAYMGFQTPCS